MTRPTGRTLETSGRDAHGVGDYRAAVNAYEQAFAAYRRDGDILAAARAARTVAWFNGWVFGDWAVHRGWVSRARRLLETADHEPGRGWVLLDDALSGNDLETQRGQYLAAIDLARAFGDHDLECDATASLGMMLVFSGHIEDGMALLDEALAAICGGDVTELPVVEGCLCGLLTACERTYDLGRADQWLRAAQTVMRRKNLVSVAGYCRAHYAGILIAAGRWDDAEDELTTVLDQLPDGVGVRDSARCRLAGLRIQQGRLEDAEILLAGLDHHPDHVLPAASLLVARGRPQPAIELLERVVAADLADHEAAPLLAVLVESHLSAGDLDDAAQIAQRLSALAARQQSTFVTGLAASAQARVCTAHGKPSEARAGWHQAQSLFQQAGRTVDAALARLQLARLIAKDRPDAAIAELEAAHTTFEAAGARRAADETTALLRALGGTPKTGPKRKATLTRREEEVLELLPHALTNAQIADRLFISPKTVEHHVGRILSKLGFRSRVEAATHALRR
jgi:DNA-binding CsgD family transcriptional regulator/predicted negative regulator of RcsB-dependent stress response